MSNEAPDTLAIGSRVAKTDGDYTFVGIIVGVICKRSGQIRYVVEDDRGLLLIMSRKQLHLRDK